MSTFQLILSIIYGLTVIGTIVVVISENRNPIRTLTWVLVLIFAPAVGIVLFYFFGQDNRKQRHSYENYYRYSQNVSFKALIDQIKDNKSKIPEKYSTLVNLLERSDNSWLLHGSEVKIFTDGKAKFDALIEDLEAAHHHIHIEYFLFNNDEAGQKIKEILMRKAAEGIEVRFLYENVANISVPSRFYYEMRKTGVVVEPFMKIRFPRFKSRINYRNHRKVVVIDGEIGYIGGMNVGNEYLSENWRDTHLRIKGQGVYGLQTNFLMDWYSTGETHVDDLKPYFKAEPKIYSENLLQISSGGPSSIFPNILLSTVQAVICSHDYVYIQTPYFLPPEPLFQALQSAALSGVDVRLMVSKRSDSPYVDPAARSYYKHLLAAGMRIFEHETKFIHAKTIVSDDYLSVIGSVNMDFRSFESSFEINSYLYDENLAKENKAIFLKDMEGCKEIFYDEWIKRPSWKRAIESFMRLFSPLL